MTSIELKLFDGASVIWEGRRLPPYPTEPCRRLMAVLAMRPGERISRSHLIRCLWPDEDDVPGNRLTVALYMLHRWLGDECPPLAAALSRGRGAARLASGIARIDLSELMEACARASPDLGERLGAIRSPLAGGWRSPAVDAAESELAAALDGAIARLCLAGIDRDALGGAAEHMVRLSGLMPGLAGAAARAAEAVLSAAPGSRRAGPASRLAVVAFADERAEPRLLVSSTGAEQALIWGRRAILFQGVGPALHSAQSALEQAPGGRVFLGLEECGKDGAPVAPLHRPLLQPRPPGVYVHGEAADLVERVAGVSLVREDADAFCRLK